MKKLKILFVFGFLAAVASGCADNTYNPNTQLGYRNMNSYGYNQFNSPFVRNTGYFNPYISNYSNYTQASPGLRFQWGLQAQWMWGLNTPGMFYNSCSSCSYRVHRYPLYTPNHCSCYRAPCDCAKVLTTLEHHHHHHRTSYDPPASDEKGGNESLKKDPSTEDKSISLSGNNARELMIRLQKRWEYVDGEGIQKRQGRDYLCYFQSTDKNPPSSKDASTRTDFKCVFHFNFTNKKLNEQSTGGAPDTAIQTVTILSDLGAAGGDFFIPAQHPYTDVAYDVAIMRLSSKDYSDLDLEGAFKKANSVSGNANLAYGENFAITKNADNTYTLEMYINTATGEALDYDSANSGWKVSDSNGAAKTCSYVNDPNGGAQNGWSCK